MAGAASWPARLLPSPGPPAPPRSRLARPQNIRRCEVVPRATLADLDHVDLELCVFRSHLIQLRRLLDPALIPAQLVAVHICDVRQLRLPADRTRDVGGLAVELRGPQEIGMRVADVSHGGAAREHRRYRRAPRQAVVHHRSPHDRQSTTDPPARRYLTS